MILWRIIEFGSRYLDDFQNLKVLKLVLRELFRKTKKKKPFSSIAKKKLKLTIYLNCHYKNSSVFSWFTFLKNDIRPRLRKNWRSSLFSKFYCCSVGG